MAKNENKKEINPIKDTESETFETLQNTNPSSADIAENIEEKQTLPPKEKPTTAHHGWRKFVFFIFLCLLGGMVFFALYAEQTKRQNAAAIEQMQASYDEKLTATINRINILEREVSALKNRPIVEQVAGISENQLNQKITALRHEIENRLSTLQENEKNAQDKSTSDTASTPRALPEPEIISLVATEKKTQEVLLASGAIIIRDLAEQGVSFAYEAEVLQILARGNELAENYVRTVRMFSNIGIFGKNQLIRTFDKIFADLNNTQTKQENEEKTNHADLKWYEKTWKWLKNTIVVKKGQEKPIFIPTDDEVYELVHEGRFQEALNAIKTSEKYAKIDSKPLNEWKLQVSRYIQFNLAVSGLIMNALANIHLKEMEHAAQ